MIRDDRAYLAHIVDALQQISEYTENLDDDGFRTARIVQDAVIRQFEIIGEATKNLSEEFRMRHATKPCVIVLFNKNKCGGYSCNPYMQWKYST